MNRRLALAVVVPLLVGAGAGFALGATQSDSRADNCQEAAQMMYDLVYGRDDDPATMTAYSFSFTDDYCPIDRTQN